METGLRVSELMEHWYELYYGGKSPSAEELCKDCPELLDKIRWEIEKMKRAEKHRSNATQDDVLRDHQKWTKGSEPVPGYHLTDDKPFGSGGSGEVWNATAPGKMLAVLKRVRLSQRLGQNELETMKLVRNISGHPNLLVTYAFWDLGDELVIAMERATASLKGHLEDHLKKREATSVPFEKNKLDGLPLEELLKYMQDAADGLDFLHQPIHLRGDQKVSIQHRDVKPDNLLLVGGRVKVADFGLAKALEKSTASHSGMMTLAYAAPEWWLSRQTAAQSDQYSLALSYLVLRRGKESVAADVSSLPTTEAKIVGRALARVPEERWPSCGDFVRQLKMNLQVVINDSDIQRLRQLEYTSARTLVEELLQRYPADVVVEQIRQQFGKEPDPTRSQWFCFAARFIDSPQAEKFLRAVAGDSTQHRLIQRAADQSLKVLSARQH